MYSIKSLRKTPQLVVSAALILLTLIASAEHHEFEDPGTLSAADLLSPEVLNGAHHRVKNDVRSDGYLNYYSLQSDFGEFEATSTAMLKIRIAEINALAELDSLSQTQVFIKAAADAGVGQLKTLKQFATNPVATVTGIPKGIGRMFSRYKRQAGDAVDATKEFVASDDEEVEAGESGEEGEGETTTDKAKGLTESFFGVSSAERAWSQKLGTDPYSSNEVLKAAIKEVAWAERLGRFGMGFAGVPEIPGADIIGEVNEAVWSKDPYELQDMNRARLLDTGADETLIEEYFENPKMSPSQQTLLVAAIAEMKHASGRDGILRQALNAESEAEANFLIKSVSMLAWYHLNQKPVRAVLTYAATPVGVAEDGSSALVFAVDRVYWTESIAAAASGHASQTKASTAEVWLLGSASDRAKKALSALGFTVHENVAETMVVAPSS